MHKDIYEAYIKEAVEIGRQTYGASVQGWKEAYNPDRFLGMYAGPGNIPLQVMIEGYMYYATGDIAYAEEAKRALLDISGYVSIVTEERKAFHPEYEAGIPAMDPLFQGPHYVTGYLLVKDCGLFSEQEKRQVEQAIRSSIDFLFHYPEWGAHNRSMLRVWMLSLSVKALGESDETARWAKLAHSLAEESIGGWSIEDAQLYLPLWLGSCIGHAACTQTEARYYAMPQTRYYFDFFAKAITPYGQIPDFGDAQINCYWYLWVACLEKGAAVYRCGYMKDAAARVLRFGLGGEETGSNKETVSTYVAAFLAHAAIWTDDTVKPQQPDWGSEQLLDDVIGKKMIFRESWDENAVFLMHTYRDEGEYAKVARDYLRTTISVRAEKAHHGHSDENSIVFFVKNRNILLHDGGYREQAPNGKYRNDIYHNRLVFRDGGWERGSSLYDYIHDSGSYKKAFTERLHWQSFRQLDYSRTRLYDPVRRLHWDRMITYMKQDGVFLVVDWMQSQAEQTITTSNLWHTGIVQAQGQGWFDTFVPHIYKGPGDTAPFVNRDELSLLIEFPDSSRADGQEAIKRNYGEATMIYEAESKTFGAGEMDVFVTVLTPKRKQDATDDYRNKVAVKRSREADLLSLSYKGSSEYDLAFKLDLERGLIPEPIRPRYSWESGKTAYGPIETDADFAFVESANEEWHYGLINGSGVEWNEKPLYHTPKFSSYLFESGEWHLADHKWRVWDGTVKA